METAHKPNRCSQSWPTKHGQHRCPRDAASDSVLCERHRDTNRRAAANWKLRQNASVPTVRICSRKAGSTYHCEERAVRGYLSCKHHLALRAYRLRKRRVADADRVVGVKVLVPGVEKMYRFDLDSLKPTNGVAAKLTAIREKLHLASDNDAMRFVLDNPVAYSLLFPKDSK